MVHTTFAMGNFLKISSHAAESRTLQQNNASLHLVAKTRVGTGGQPPYCSTDAKLRPPNNDKHRGANVPGCMP